MSKTLEEKINEVKEAIGYAQSRVEKQVNRNLLPQIKEIVNEFEKEDFERLDELKRIVVFQTPEAAGPDTDIFSMNVHVRGKAVYFGNLLHDLIDEAESYI